MNRSTYLVLFALTIAPSCVGPSRTRPAVLRPANLEAGVAATTSSGPAVGSRVGATSPEAWLAAPMVSASRAPLSALSLSTEPLSTGFQSSGSEAQEFAPWSRYGASIAGVATSVDSGIRVGLPGVGVDINLEELLNLDSSTSTVRAEAFWRFTENRRHRLDLSWIDLGRESSKTLDRDIDIGGGDVIPAGSFVATSLDINLLKAQYSYSVFQDERFDLALAGGLYVAPIDFSLQASGLSTLERSLGVTAPLPAVGFRFDFAVTPRWYLRSDVSVFYLEIAEFTGAMTSFTGGVEYRAWEHVALGLGFDSFQMRVERNGSTKFPGINEAGSVDFGYFGLALSLKTVW